MSGKLSVWLSEEESFRSVATGKFYLFVKAFPTFVGLNFKGLSVGGFKVCAVMKL